MVITMALCFLAGVMFFGGVNPDVAAPMFALGFFGGLLWALQLVLCPDSTWKRSPMNWPVLAFLLYALIRYFTTPFEHKARVELFQVGLCALAYFVAANQFQRPAHRTWLIAGLIALAVFESGMILWQVATKSDIVFEWVRPELYRGRGSGSYICPNNMAALLEMALGLIAARAAMVNIRTGSLEKFVLRKLVIVYAALMAIGGILLTFSRTGWLATLVGLVLLLFWGDWRLHLSRARIALVLAAFAMIGLAMWEFGPIRNYVEHSFTVRPGDDTKGIALRDASIGGRIHMFEGTMKLIADRPVFGSGIGSWEWVYAKYKHPQIDDHPEHTHNEFLNLVSDYGLTGFFLLLAFFIGFYRHSLLLTDARLSSEQRAFAVGGAVSVGALLVHSCFDFPLHIPANSVLLAVITGAVAAMDDPAGRFPARPLRPVGRYALAMVLLAGCGAGIWFYGRTALAAHYTTAGNDAKFHHILDKSIALDFYERAIALDPHNPEPYTKIGDVYRSQAVWRRDPEKQSERSELAQQAVREYTLSLELNPLQSEVLLKLGQAHEMALQDPDALRAYLRSIEVDPGNAFSHSVLGRYYRDRGDTNAAYQEFLKSIRLNSWADSQAGLNLIDIPPPPEPAPSPAAPTTNGTNRSVNKPPSP
jgi:O-antigen ligase